MKICIVGPGYMNIPPSGWGAVEILIDDYRKTLLEMGHQVEIVNTRNLHLAIALINAINPDFVHIQYEEYAPIVSALNCKHVAITSHYAYLTQPDKWNVGYKEIFWNTVNSKSHIFCLSNEIAELYQKAGVSKTKVQVIPNGVRIDLFKFEEICKKPNESICLAKIENRKRQHLASDIPGIKFAGNACDNLIDLTSPIYLGEWNKKNLYENLTDFANMVLLSDGEAHPLVCMEAMAAGLGLVVSEYCAANLDIRKEFITIIPEDKIKDIQFVKDATLMNRKISLKLRKEIRDYAISFDWKNIIRRYIETINQIRGS